MIERIRFWECGTGTGTNGFKYRKFNLVILKILHRIFPINQKKMPVQFNGSENNQPLLLQGRVQPWSMISAYEKTILCCGAVPAAGLQ